MTHGCLRAGTLLIIETMSASQIESFPHHNVHFTHTHSLDVLKPKGKPGNVITRMYARTGWWPLIKDSEQWEKAIDTLGGLCKPSKHRVGDKLGKLADLGDKTIIIRQKVLDSFQGHFVDKAHAAEEHSKQKRRQKRQNRVSITNTSLGLLRVKSPVCVHACIFVCVPQHLSLIHISEPTRPY